MKYLGAEPVIAKAPSEVDGERMVIPGVGAFGDGMNNLRPFENGITVRLEKSGKDLPL